MTIPKNSITPPAASTAASATSNASSSAASPPATTTPRGNSVTRTTLWLVAAVSVITAIAYATGTNQIDAIRMTLRTTARMSLGLFLLAFTAAALAQLFPSGATQWLRRHRRSLGLGFAASHSWHLLAIISLAKLHPATFAALTNPVTIISGSITYALIFAMAATSFDVTARAIGPRAWRWLHTIGAWFIWVSFLIAEGKRIPGNPFYALPFALVLIAVALKFAARQKAKVAT